MNGAIIAAGDRPLWLDGVPARVLLTDEAHRDVHAWLAAHEAELDVVLANHGLTSSVIIAPTLERFVMLSELEHVGATTDRSTPPTGATS